MALTQGLISSPLKTFILTLNQTTQEDPDAAITQFCQELETLVFNAIKAATITLPSGTVIVQGANSGGPVVATNQSPLPYNKVIT